MNARGLTLLETMIALVIIGVTVGGALGAVVESGQTVRNAAAWTDAVGYAEDALERARSGDAMPDSAGAERLAGGYVRWVERAPWRGNLRQVTAIVILPSGARFTLSALEVDR